MFCQKCGKQISDTSKFCAFCGSAVQKEQTAERAAAFDDEATVVIPRPSEKKGGGEQAAPDAEPVPVVPVREAAPEPVPVVPAQEAAPEPVPVVPVQEAEPETIPVVPVQEAEAEPEPEGTAAAGGKAAKSHTGIVFAILGIIVIALAALLVFLVRTLFGGSSSESRVFYLKGEELSAILDIRDSDAKSVELETIRDNEYYDAGRIVQLDSDGEYLYYFSKIDSDGEYGTLCRIPTAKIKEKESANEKLVEEIDSRVSLYSGFRILKDDSVLYLRKNDNLTWYKDGETYDLGDCSNGYRVTDGEDYAVCLDGDTLVAVEISAKHKTTEIDDDVSSLLAVGGKDFILYCKADEDDDEKDLYVAGVSKDPKAAAEDVASYYAVDAGSKGFYYTLSVEADHKLYDYVEDPYAEEDAKLSEPQSKDFLVEVKESKAISESDQEYFDSSDDFYDYLTDGYYDDSLEAWYYWNYDDGEDYYYREGNRQWYALDRDAYSEAYDEYYDAADRISLREDLQSETVTDFYYELYYWNDGSSTEVCMDAGGVRDADGRAVLYTKTAAGSEPEKTYRIDEIDSVYALREDIEYGDDGREDAAYYFSSGGGAETEVTGLDEISSMYTSEDGKTILLVGDGDDEGYVMCSYTAGGSGDGIEVSDCGVYVGKSGNEFYYFEDFDDDMGELYVFDGAKSYLLAKDVMRGIFYAEDGNVAGYRDWDWDDGDGELAAYNKKGEDELISKDVSSYCYLENGAYLLVKNGDLYYRNKNGDENRLARDVDYFLAPGAADGHWIY